MKNSKIDRVYRIIFIVLMIVIAFIFPKEVYHYLSGMHQLSPNEKFIYSWCAVAIFWCFQALVTYFIFKEGEKKINE